MVFPSPMPYKTPIGVMDGDNFYVSCERVFRPSLKGKPVVVLSNNDGCVIARSEEAKELGIPMGAPFFTVREILHSHGGVALSANFPLYGDISRRFFSIAKEVAETVEIYSVDEGFFTAPEGEDIEKVARTIQERVKRWVGIPLSIGIGSTRTLAKRAVKKAKKTGEIVSYLHLPEEEKETPVEEIWGIHKGRGAILRKNGVTTIGDLLKTPSRTIRKWIGIEGVRIQQELLGIPCLTEPPQERKTILFSRTLPEPLKDRDRLERIVLHFTYRATMRLLSLGRVAGIVGVFLSSRKGTLWKYTSLDPPSAFPQETLKRALSLFSSLYEEEELYKRVGVGFFLLYPSYPAPLSLFHSRPTSYEKVTEVVEKLTKRFGMEKIRIGCPTVEEGLSLGRYRTPAYTTRWEDLPVVW